MRSVLKPHARGRFADHEEYCAWVSYVEERIATGVLVLSETIPCRKRRGRRFE